MGDTYSIFTQRVDRNRFMHESLWRPYRAFESSFSSSHPGRRSPAFGELHSALGWSVLPHWGDKPKAILRRSNVKTNRIRPPISDWDRFLITIAAGYIALPPARLLLVARMQQRLDNLSDTVHRDSIPLLDGQGMFGGFQLNERSLTDRLSMYVGPQK
jgi:hypothetical protein